MLDECCALCLVDLLPPGSTKLLLAMLMAVIGVFVDQLMSVCGHEVVVLRGLLLHWGRKSQLVRGWFCTVEHKCAVLDWRRVPTSSVPSATTIRCPSRRSTVSSRVGVIGSVVLRGWWHMLLFVDVDLALDCRNPRL